MKSFVATIVLVFGVIVFSVSADIISYNDIILDGGEDQARDQMYEEWVAKFDRMAAGFDAVNERNQQEQNRQDQERQRRARQEQIDNFNNIVRGESKIIKSGIETGEGKEKGVAIHNEIITPFDSSYADYYIVFPSDLTLPYKTDEILQIIRELIDGIYLYDTEPWLSLYTYQDTMLEVLLKPPYQSSLIAETLINLDYRMKGILHGGYFPLNVNSIWYDEFIKAKTEEQERQVLRKYGYIDLHKNQQYESFVDKRNSSKIVTIDRLKNTMEIGMMIHSFLPPEIKSYQNLYLLDSTCHIDYNVTFTNSYEQTIKDYEKMYDRLPAWVLELYSILDSTKNVVADVFNNDTEIRVEFEKLKIITYLAGFIKTLKKNGMIPITYNVKRQYPSRQYLPGVVMAGWVVDVNDIFVRKDFNYSVFGGVNIGSPDSKVQNSTSWVEGDNLYNGYKTILEKMPRNSFVSFPYGVQEQSCVVLRLPVYKDNKNNQNYDWLFALDKE